jgi:hypothetical protein
MFSEVSRHRMFCKHPMSFCRASTVYPRRISPNKGFPDIGCLADIRCLTVMNPVRENEIGFAIIKLVRGNNHSPLQIFVNEPYWDFSLR